MPRMNPAFIPGLGDAASAALAAVLATAAVAALFLRSRLAAAAALAAAAQEKMATEAEAALLAEKARATATLDGLQARFDATAARLADLEQRHAAHRDSAERRLLDASQHITRLESDLGATREVAAQLPPTQARIKDLEVALATERGRFAALDKAVEAHRVRAADLETRLAEAQAIGLKMQEEAEARDIELRRLRAQAEALAAEGGMENEVKKAHEATRAAEAKAAQLQKSLSASEARLAMVQKEFMTAVGTVPLATTTPSSADKRVRELEEKIAQLEADSRKKAREDGYKIAELEYRLSEALEKTTPRSP